MIRVLLADDHPVVREGVKRIIAGARDMAVIGEAGTGPELLAQVAARPCDVVVMDLAMPGRPGLEVLHEIRRDHPRLPVLILSMYPADQYAVRTVIGGASAYLHKGGPPDELVRAIRTVATGRRYLTDEVAQRLAAHLDRASQKPPHEQLSNREFEVLCLIAAGRTISEIAEQLAISVKTVSTFRRRLLEKLGLRHNAELVRYALEHDLLR